MWWSIWGASSGWEIINLTPEEIQEKLIHAWKDIEETETEIKQVCYRCNKERILKITL